MSSVTYCLSFRGSLLVTVTALIMAMGWHATYWLRVALLASGLVPLLVSLFQDGRKYSIYVWQLITRDERQFELITQFKRQLQ